MSNIVTIVCTKFVDLDDEDNPDAIHYGYRVFDDFEKSYENFEEEKVVREALNDPQKCLSMVRNSCDERVFEMIDHAKLFDGSLDINGQVYDAEEWTHWV